MEFFNLTMPLMICFLSTNYCCSFIRIIVVKMLSKSIVTDLTSCKSGPPDSLPGCDQPLLEGYNQRPGVCRVERPGAVISPGAGLGLDVSQEVELTLASPSTWASHWSSPGSNGADRSLAWSKLCPEQGLFFEVIVLLVGRDMSIVYQTECRLPGVEWSSEVREVKLRISPWS